MNWSDYASLADRLYKQSGFIYVGAEFCWELQDIFLSLVARTLSDDKEIKILINSSGGSSMSCMAMRNSLLLARMREKKSVGVVLSRAYSAAFLLLQSCDTRLAMEGSTLLMHHGSSQLDNNELAAINRGESWPAEHRKRFNDELIEAVQRRTGVTKKKLFEYFDTERYFSAGQSLDENFVDGVVSSYTEIPAEVLTLLS